jgi:hypothetical protein
MYMQHKVSYLSFFIFAEKLSILDMIGIGESRSSVGSPVAFRWLQGSVFLKLKVGALPYHLRRRSNCTSQAEANTTTTTTHANNSPNKTLHHLNLGEKGRKKPPRTAPLSPTLCHNKSRGPLQA